MPIYEFECPHCRERFEALSRMGEDGSTLECPRCGATGMEKVWSTFAAATGGGAVPPGCGGGFT
jgi:putative FmdB family regulatory protein